MKGDFLYRFISAQDGKYEKALKEIKIGKKTSHWMWYIFPILRRDDLSDKSIFYGISGIEEAIEYINHPVLGARLIECCEALMEHDNKHVVDIFGKTDALKLRSSMTLFELANKENPIFSRVLDKFFNGRRDAHTSEQIHSTKYLSPQLIVHDGILVGGYGLRGVITIPKGVTKIAALAFYKCHEIQTVTVPEGVEVIGMYAFAGCEKLESITLPRSARTMERNAFTGCKMLADDKGLIIVKGFLFDCLSEAEDVVIPEGVRRICQYSFSKCVNMKTLVVPKSVKRIAPLAFLRCNELQKIIIEGDDTRITERTFEGCENITICARWGSYMHLYAVKNGISFEAK